MIINKNDIKSIIKKYQVNQREALILLSVIKNITYTDVFFLKEIELTEEELSSYNEYLKRRSKKEPIAKIIGFKVFYGISFKTTKDTLDPRPDTETLIDAVLNTYKNKESELKILDLGCGTGCLGLTLLTLYEKSICDFVDISQSAIDVAKCNATKLNILSRSSFVQSNWFEKVDSKYDLIVSNPPYISKNFKLDKDTLYDPSIALFADNDGISEYETILKNVHKFLKPNSYIFLEIGFDQYEKIKKINTDLEFVRFYKDLNNINRCAVFYAR